MLGIATAFLIEVDEKWPAERKAYLKGRGQEFSCKLTPVDSDAARCVYEADFGSFKTRGCDYASAGNAILEDPRFFSIFF